jgi:hypothetical protein
MDPSIVVFECPLGHQVVTRKVHYGETPLVVECDAGRCQAVAVKLDPTPIDAAARRPTREWYRPDRREQRRLARDAVDWVRSGGLLIRKATPNREAV